MIKAEHIFLKLIIISIYITINYSLVKCIENLATHGKEKYGGDLEYNMSALNGLNSNQSKSLEIFKVAVNEFNELNNVKENRNVGSKYTLYERKYVKEPSTINFTIKTLNFTSHVESNLFHLFMNLFDHLSWNISHQTQNISYGCATDMQIYLGHLNIQSKWALKAFDSSGHYGGQSLFGNDFWLGSKSFCEEINKDYTKKTKEPFVIMSFFVAIIKANISQFTPEQKLLHLGQCLPKSCSKDDVLSMLKDDPNSILLKKTMAYQLKNLSSQSACEPLEVVYIRNVPGTYSLYNDVKLYILCSIITILAIIMMLAFYKESLFEMKSKMFDSEQVRCSKYGHDRNSASMELNILNRNENSAISTSAGCSSKLLGKFYETLRCFSIRSNSKSILSVSANSEDSITCIHGLRLYSLLWTIMVHTYLQLYAVGENRYRRTITERSFIYQIVGNATFSVDTFFFISGMLVVVLFYRSVNKNNVEMEQNLSENKYIYKTTIKILISIVYRYIRLTPTYLFVIIFNEIALKWTYEQSVFTPGIIDHITCNKYWWRNILYINNWYPFNEMCMIWSWYLANDMQLYLLAIVLLALSIRFKTPCLIIISLIMICAWITSIYLSLHHNYSYKVAEPFDSFDILYDKPWQRITPYIMGMLTGYIIHFKKTPPKVSRIVNSSMWIISLTIIFGLIFGVWNGQLSVPATAIYVSLGHTAWGAALIWITLSCCWGYSPFINNMLSYGGIHPLSRLSYCAYLLHPVIMMITSFQLEAPIHLQHGIIITIFFGNAVLSFTLAYFVSLMFEAPVIKLLKLAFKNK